MPSADEWERQLIAKTEKQIINIAANSKLNNSSKSIEEPKQGELDNPAFIWPGPTTRTMHGRYAPVRGYIRRLNEFYTKMGNASDIKNRRCNFQFQPESFERTVSADAINTQFFFNQDPGQLTVPIPGQSSYTLKLMFNREAEVASGKYVTNTTGGSTTLSKLINPFNSTNDDDFNIFAAQRYLNSDYDKSWVCQIGVLADIFVLDSIIGQGMNKETVSTLQRIVDRNKQEADKKKTTAPIVDPKDTDDQDKVVETTTSNDYWAANSGNLANNPNIGNTAFLVPTPVRIMLSNLLMIEGFVTSSSVNIHKFTNRFIPTQAVVSLSIQALYVGFAKNQTMLTTNIGEEGNVGAAAPDTKDMSKAQLDAYNQILNGTKSLYSKIVSGKTDLSILEIITPVNKTEQIFNFELEISPAGKLFINNNLDKAAGKTANFIWKGTIKMWWHSYASDGTRGFTSINAPAHTLILGAPSDSALVKWGTQENPLTLAVGSGQMRENYKNIGDSGVSDHVIGKKEGQPFAGEDAKWSLYEDSTIDSSIPRPFIEDKFNIELNIELQLEFDGTTYPAAQIAHVRNAVACGDDVLFKGITFTVPAS